MNPTDKNNTVSKEEEEILKCDACQGIVLEDELTRTPGGEDYCEDCFSESYSNCDSCNEFYENDDCHQYNGEYYCADCYSESFVDCVECEEIVNRDYAMWSEREEQYYCEDCYPGEGEDVDLESYGRVNLHKSKCFNRNKFSRAVGIELEAINEDYDCMDSDFYEDNWEFKNNWNVIHDGSIDSGEGKGREFITRGGLSGDELYQSIDNITSMLKFRGWQVNRSCGMHVHIDARDLNWREIKYILAVSKLSEQIIYKMLPRSRVDGRWCKRIPIDINDILNIKDNQDFIDTWYQSFDTYPSYDKYNDSRYCGTNMHSRIIHGSIEFRHHSGTLDSDKIINWIEICQKIVDAGIKLAKLNKGNITRFKEYIGIYELNQHIESSKESMIPLDIHNFCRLLNIDNELKEYITKRILKFYNSDKIGEYEEISIYHINQ